MYLITYRCESKGREIWGYSFSESVGDFLSNVQKYEEETYFIVNSLAVTYEFYNEWDGKLAGT